MIFGGHIQNFKGDLIKTHIGLCGQHMLTLLPETGQITPLDYHCHRWRECSKCLDARAEEEKCRIEGAKNKGQTIKIEYVSKAGLNVLIKQIKKAGGDYRRFPLPGDQVAVLHNIPNVPGSPVFNLEKLDWSRLVATPSSESIRGSLGQLPAKPEDTTNERVLVSYRALASNLSPYAEADVTREILQRTWVMKPNAQTLQSCLDTRIALMVSLLAEHGNTIEFGVFMRKWVKITQIDWTPVDRDVFAQFFA